MSVTRDIYEIHKRAVECQENGDVSGLNANMSLLAMYSEGQISKFLSSVGVPRIGYLKDPDGIIVCLGEIPYTGDIEDLGLDLENDVVVRFVRIFHEEIRKVIEGG